MTKRTDLHIKYANAILRRPVKEAEKDLSAIRFVYDDAEADAIISKFSAAMCMQQNQKRRDLI